MKHEMTMNRYLFAGFEEKQVVITDTFSNYHYHYQQPMVIVITTCFSPKPTNKQIDMKHCK